MAWYAIQVKPRYEKHVSQVLQQKGYEEFLPLYQARRRWKYRTKLIDFPLFPGYLFCRFDVSDRLPVLTTPGVLHLIGAGKTPLPVGDQEIVALRTVLRAKLPVEPWPYLRTGQRVRIEVGPLRGLEGIVQAVKNDCRLILSVTLLQRSVAVDISSDWVSCPDFERCFDSIGSDLSIHERG
jgi:transcription antitermination factor NusG